MTGHYPIRKNLYSHLLQLQLIVVRYGSGWPVCYFNGNFPEILVHVLHRHRNRREFVLIAQFRNISANKKILACFCT